MQKQRFETGKAPQLTISECHGSLAIRSWAEGAVVVRGNEVMVEETEAGLTIRSHGGLKIMAPEAASVALTGAAHGDLLIKNVAGDIALNEVMGDVMLSGISHAQINTIHSDLALRHGNGRISVTAVHGDAALRNVSDIHIDQISGDFSARYVNGAVELGEVRGDVALRTVNGDVTVGRVYRDANLRNLAGQLQIDNVHGDVRLYDSLPGGDHSLTAQGDIVLRWPVDAPLNVTANAPRIINQLPLEDLVEKEGFLSGKLNDGTTNLSLRATRVILKPARLVKEEWDAFQADEMDFDFAFDLEKLGEQISAQVNQQVAQVAAELETKLGHDFAQKVTRNAEKAARQAEKVAERIRRQAENRMRMSEEFMDRRRRTASTPPPPRAKKATQEEILKILKMVEQGTISPEEAEMLLDALEE